MNNEDRLKLKAEMLAEKNWAVVGVSSKTDRFGYKIWKKLKEHGYQVFPVSPNYDKIEGETIYHNLGDVPYTIGVVNMVVPRSVSMQVLDQMKALGIRMVFFQPGSYDKVVLTKARDLGLKIIHGDCIYRTMVEMEEANRKPESQTKD